MNRGHPDEDVEQRFARLVTVVRHELLGPLTVIRGFATLLAAQEDRDELEAIRRNSALAMLLLDRLRDADDIVQGKDLELELTDTDLVDLVANMIDDVDGTMMSDHTVEFEAPEEPVHADVDGDRIRQVLFNLLSNAAKYSDPGTVVVVRVRAHDEVVEIAVTNEGEGIAPADIERAFTAFSRLSNEAPGTGLGLAISRGIARAHGGDLTAEPAPDNGSGSLFVLTIPRG